MEVLAGRFGSPGGKFPMGIREITGGMHGGQVGEKKMRFLMARQAYTELDWLLLPNPFCLSPAPLVVTAVWLCLGPAFPRRETEEVRSVSASANFRVSPTGRL